LVVLFIAASADLWLALMASITATLAFNFFFLPPVGTLELADPNNWIVLAVFLAVGTVAGQLSAKARRQASLFLEERHAAELAAQRAELSSTLLAVLSHDLRTPLTAIRTAISNIALPGADDALRREQARVAEQEAARLTRLFDEILDMARIDSGAVAAERSWVTPAEIVEAALSQAATALNGRELRIEAVDDAEVAVDPRLNASAVAHLVENAAQYAPDGPIHVRAWTEQKALRIEVRDSGPGIAPEEFTRLFEPFYRGERHRGQVAGTGMGLAITRGLVAADGGRVWAEHVTPHGASFSIAVPAATRRAGAE
jgi:two-component system sensor histidine kinase KdpD